MVKETHGVEHSSTGSNSQSESSDFGYGPITAEIGLATSGEIENLPLEETNCDLPKIEKNHQRAYQDAFFAAPYAVSPNPRCINHQKNNVDLKKNPPFSFHHILVSMLS